MYNKKNILFLCSWFPNRTIPYNGNFIARHGEAAALINNVKALHVVDCPNIKTKFDIEHRTENGLESYVIYYKKVTSNIPVYKLILKLKRHFQGHLLGKKLIEQDGFKIDVVHLNVLIRAGFIALFFKYRFGLPYVVSENWTGFLPLKRTYEKSSWFFKFMHKWIANKASYLLPVSKDLEEAYKSHGFTSDVIIVPNVVDTVLFKSDQLFKNDQFTIVHVSNFKEDHKNMTGLLRTIHQLSKQRKDFKLKIVGDGDVAGLKAKAEVIGLDPSIYEIIGRSPIDIVAEHVKSSDLFILFSNWENLPCVVLEAFAAGLPVVSSDVGGTREHLTKDKGLLVEAKDETQFLSSIQYVLDNYDNYNNTEIAQYAEDHFSYINIGKAFDDVYNKVLNN